MCFFRIKFEEEFKGCRQTLKIYSSNYLHANNGINEKQHADQKTNVGQCLKNDNDVNRETMKFLL